MDGKDYWKECIAIAADECGLTITEEQLSELAASVKSGHENYGMAFYSPPSSERLDSIESEYKRKLNGLQADFDRYRDNSETAIKQALRIHREDHVSIGEHGSVFTHGGRTEQIQ